MKLIVLYNTTDECTWSYDHVMPIEAESEEYLACALEDWCNFCKRRDNWWEDDEFKKTNIYAHELMPHGEYYAPEILTLDAWFERTRSIV